MHECSCKDAFTSAVPKVTEGATGNVKGIVPAVGVFILPRMLDPLENLEEGIELDLSIGQFDALETFSVAFAPASLL